MNDWTVEIVDGLSTVEPASWNALVGKDNPFVEFEFLAALEQSGSVGPGTGWNPAFVLLRQAAGGQLIAATPLYIKEHSYGEYIFDWSWAGAADRAGLNYYPKLVVAVPFTPATGPRLLISEHIDAKSARQHLVAGIHRLSDAIEASSVHLLFLTEPEQRALAAEHGFMARTTHQYHWHNANYESFEHYLSHFRSAARKQVKRERRRAAGLPVEIQMLRGDEMNSRQWAALFTFYCDTISRKWGYPYLTREFFALIRETFAKRVLAAVAMKGETPVAASLYFQKGKHLYGRYWGCNGDYDFLHFELCYYRAIEYCIDHGLALFEAGAQGQHKVKRGLMPHPTYSSHWLRHPGLRQGVERFVRYESSSIEQEIDAMARCGPFKQPPE